MATEGFDLKFGEDAVRRIAEIAAQVNDATENIGARRLYTVLERLLESIVKSETKRDKGERGAVPLDKRDTVIKLSHQGWSVPEISRVTQLSRGGGGLSVCPADPRRACTDRRARRSVGWGRACCARRRRSFPTQPRAV